MGKHSLVKQNKRAFNKTLAIALTAGMSLSAVTVAAPTAGAVAGHEGANYWYDASSDGVLSPQTQDDVATWGYTSYLDYGGVFTDVPTSDGLLTGFSETDAGYHAGRVKDGVKRYGDQPYGEATQLSAMKTLGLHPQAPVRDMSMDAKKMLYVAYSFANDIAQNDGLTQEARDALAAHGYKGDFYDEFVMSADTGISKDYEVLLSDKKMSAEEIREKATTDRVMAITKADYVAVVASTLAGSAYRLDGGGAPVGVKEGGDDRPLTFGDMYDRNNFAFVFDEYDESDDQTEDRYSMAYAMIEIARNVSDEEINNSDLKVYTHEDPSIPLFFSLSNSSPAPVEELPHAPVEDIYVDKVTEIEDGKYEIERNDGKKFTIDVSDLYTRVKDLENKDTVSPEDLDKIKDDLDKVKDDIKDLKANDDKLQDEIDKINDDLDKLTPRVDDLEDRVTDLENTVIKEVRDNGDGTYTLIRNDDSEVPGKIGDGQDIKELIPNEDGTMTIIHKDGSKSKVDLKQVTITEDNQGTPEHTVTITSPNGDSVTFNVFDKYVTNVVKNESGDYDIFRSDIDGGKTVWKTIVLSDLRDKISNLEDRADKLEKKDQALQDEIDELKDRMGKAEDNIKGLQDKTEGLEDDVRKINAHLSTLDLRVSAIDAKLSVLEGRVDDLEDTNKKWAECYSGIGMAAIPLAIAAPLAGLANMDIPFLNQANTDIQKRLGVYNPDLAKAWGQYGGIMKAVAGLVGLMGAIGAITYAGNQCNPYNQTDDVKDTKLGKLSSKFESAKAESSSKK